MRMLKRFLQRLSECCRMGLTQNQVASALDVTTGYICNVENGRTAMSLKLLIYYAKLMGVSLDALVGGLDSNYHATALDNELMVEICKMDDVTKEKLLKTIKLWNSDNKSEEK